MEFRRSDECHIWTMGIAAEVEFLLGDDYSKRFSFDGNAHGPDVTFIGAAKLHLFNPRRRVQLFVPDLAIEIVSENDKFKPLMEKPARYRKCGTKEVWVLSPETRQAFVQSEERQVILGDDQMFESKLIPGFAIGLAELFDRA